MRPGAQPSARGSHSPLGHPPKPTKPRLGDYHGPGGVRRPRDLPAATAPSRGLRMEPQGGPARRHPPDGLRPNPAELFRELERALHARASVRPVHSWRYRHEVRRALHAVGDVRDPGRGGAKKQKGPRPSRCSGTNAAQVLLHDAEMTRPVP